MEYAATLRKILRLALHWTVSRSMERWRVGLARARKAGRFGPLVRFGDATQLIVRDFTVVPMGGQQAPLPPGGYDVGV